uniref:Ig-like domain-containing protein n=1 Tax=Sander lucioperca TaxID=283035 RepID=A0A8D0DFQ3_SANLU
MTVCLLHISLLWSVCEARISDVSQPAAFQAVELGHTVTFTCYIKSAARTRVWYTLNTERRLQLLASTDTLYNLTIFEDKSHRYEVQLDHISSLLTIPRTTWEDVGTYYCGVMDLRDIQFGQGTFLMIKGANPISDSGVQQRESEPVQPGDSVTLSCSVHTGRCAAEHISVTWLKNSHHSAPQMIYYSGNKICQRTESGETSCVYELLLRNLSSDDAGTFYCVLTSCGQTLFGNGTRIIVHSKTRTQSLNTADNRHTPGKSTSIISRQQLIMVCHCIDAESPRSAPRCIGAVINFNTPTIRFFLVLVQFLANIMNHKHRENVRSILKNAVKPQIKSKAS